MNTQHTSRRYRTGQGSRLPVLATAGAIALLGVATAVAGTVSPQQREEMQVARQQRQEQRQEQRQQREQPPRTQPGRPPGGDFAGSPQPPRGNPGGGYGRPPGGPDSGSRPPPGAGRPPGNNGNNGNANYNRPPQGNGNWGQGNGGNWRPDRGRPPSYAGNGHGYRPPPYYGRPGYRPPPPRYVPTLPAGYARHYWNGSPYYYSSGYWYRPWGSSYTLVGAPYGLFVPTLPSYYSAFWYGGSRYFLAGSTYYLYDSTRRGYVVSQSPYGEDDEGSSGSAVGEEIYVYPARGQSEQQTADDRYECHRWAVDQTGYDPVESSYDANRREEYVRAITACLTGRGYTVG